MIVARVRRVYVFVCFFVVSLGVLVVTKVMGVMGTDMYMVVEIYLLGYVLMVIWY